LRRFATVFPVLVAPVVYDELIDKCQKNSYKSWNSFSLEEGLGLKDKFIEGKWRS
jgi:hypothetical protein